MRGILLAGGRNSRLLPTTIVVNKQMLPVYEKPMIYYPLSTLMLAGIREILIISTERDLPAMKSLLGDGEWLGLRLSYQAQHEPRGIADALLLGAEFLAEEPCALVLGDNLHAMDRAAAILSESARLREGALLFAHQVPDPSRFGVAQFDATGNLVDVVEKPKVPESNWAVTGLYFYDGSASDRARSLLPSPRGELEITDLNRSYLADSMARAHKMSRSSVWMDMGTPSALLKASQYVSQVQRQTGMRIGCVEEIAFRQGFIDSAAMRDRAKSLAGSDYGDYLLELCGDRAE